MNQLSKFLTIVKKFYDLFLTNWVYIPYVFNARAGHDSGRYSFGHISPAASAREVFKPSADSANLLVSTEKNSVFDLGFSGEVVTSGGVIAFFWPTPGPRRQSNEPIFCLKFFFKLDYHPGL